MRRSSIVFDMDGVLLDTETLGLNIWRQIAGKYGLEQIEQTIYACMGKNFEASKRVFQERYGQDIPFEEYKKEESTGFYKYIETHGVPLKSGAYEILQHLKIKGYMIALATSTENDRARWELDQADLLRYFDFIVSGDMVDKSKPSPDIYLAACRNIGAVPEDTYAVEDSFAGVYSASSAGLKTIMVPDRLQPDPEIVSVCISVQKDLYGAMSFLEAVNTR